MGGEHSKQKTSQCIGSAAGGMLCPGTVREPLQLELSEQEGKRLVRKVRLRGQRPFSRSHG